MRHNLPEDTIRKPPDRGFLIAHFSAWRSPRATRIALSGSHRLSGINGTKPSAPPCAPNSRRDINNSRPGRAPEWPNLVRSKKLSQRVRIRSGMPHDTPESSHLPARSLHLEFDFLDCVIFVSRVARWGCRLLGLRPTCGCRP